MSKLSLIATFCLGVASIAPTAALADSPREFLHKALQGDNSEIMLGRLAADRARSPAVRDFGQTLASDHGAARDQVMPLLRRYGLRPDREVADEARRERDRLMGMRGRDFDREFVRYMVDDHRKDIRDFRDEAQERHGAVSDLARDQLPTLRKHLDIATALDRSDGRSGQGFSDRDSNRDRLEGREDRYRDANRNGYDDHNR